MSPDQVRGRDALVDDLVERVSQHRMAALLGPRRFGKTSVLGKVAEVCAESGASVVWVDLYETSSHADLVVRLGAALAAARGPARSTFASTAATVSLNLGLLTVEFARKPSRRPDAQSLLHVVLDTLVAGALKHPTIVVIDEFASIGNVTGAAGLLRTKLQHHVQDIGVLFAGSEPTTMTAMFADPAMPFYNQADLVPIEGFTLAELTDIVAEGFVSTGRDAGGLASSLFGFTAGHPYRSMQLADAVWQRVDEGATCGSEEWSQALAAVRAGSAAAHDALFAAFDANEQTVLRAIAGGRGLYGSTLELLGASSGAVTAAHERLRASGTVAGTTSELRIVDPLFADWVQRRFDL